MVTLQGEKKRWNGTKPWCLNDLVSSFNPCAPCSLGSLCIFPCFLSSSSGLNYPLMMIPLNWTKWAFIWPVLSELASRVETLAVASSGFFTSGFVPRQLWGLDRLTRLRVTSLAMVSKLVNLLASQVNWYFCLFCSFHTQLAMASCPLHFFMFSCF